MQRSIVLVIVVAAVVSGLMGGFAYSQLMREAGAAPAPSQVIVASPVDGAGNVKVHEQGTAAVSGTVSVGNQPAVTVSNLPTDGTGNVRVSGVTTRAPGRLILVADSVNLAPSGTFTSPFADTADCRSLALFMNITTGTVQARLSVSADGITGPPAFAAFTGSAPGSVHYFDAGEIEGSGSPVGLPMVAPKAAVFLREQTGSTSATVDKAWLFCSQ